MSLVRLAALALASLSVPSAAAAQESPIVVRADVARAEIERVLEADNVDTSRLTPGEVVELMARIRRGRAPEGFWAAYRAHFAAWQRLAEAVRRRDAAPGPAAAEAVARADQAIGASFDEVERSARRYGARLPAPAWSRAPNPRPRR